MVVGHYIPMEPFQHRYKGGNLEEGEQSRGKGKGRVGIHKVLKAGLVESQKRHSLMGSGTETVGNLMVAEVDFQVVKALQEWDTRFHRRPKSRDWRLDSEMSTQNTTLVEVCLVLCCLVA